MWWVGKFLTSAPRSFPPVMRPALVLGPPPIPPMNPPPPSPPPRPPFAPPFPWLPIREFIFHIKNSTSPIVTTVLNARLLFSRLSTAPNSTLFFCSCSYGTVASSGRAAAIGTRKGSVFPQLV